MVEKGFANLSGVQIGFLVLILFVVGFFVFDGFDLLPFSLTGVFDSDLLTLSAGSLQFVEGYNQPLQTSDGVVLASFVVGAGNDVAAVGTYDEQPVQGEQISSVPSGYDADDADFFFIGKKERMGTNIPILGGTQNVKIVEEPLVASGTSVGYSVGLVPDPDEIFESQVSAAESKFQECVRSPQWIAFGWKEDGICWENDPNGECYLGSYDFDAHGQIVWVCIKPQSWFWLYELGAPSADMELKFEIERYDGDTTDILTIDETMINNQQTTAYLYDNGQPVAFIAFAGLLQTLASQVDLQDEVVDPDNYPYLIYSQNARDNHAQEIQFTRALGPQSVDQVRYREGSYEDVYNQATPLQITYNNVLSSATDQLDEEFDFTIEGDVLRIDNAYSFNPLVSVTILGNWIGIIRDVSELDIVCGSSVSGSVGETLSSTVSIVHGGGGGSQSYTVSYDCPGGTNTFSDNVATGETNIHQINLNFINPGEGTCVMNLNWAGDNDSCGIAYDIEDIPELCGNGIIDAGEDCDGFDFGGKSCGTFSYQGGNLSCTQACTINLNNCSNPICDNDGTCDAGETEASCPEDCKPPEICGLFIEGFIYHEVTHTTTEDICAFGVKWPFTDDCIVKIGEHTTSETVCEIAWGQVILIVITVLLVTYVYLLLKGKK